ncbi:MAG: MotA/TolQ/ExbB proton channel family protein [Campylobacterota bacterium]|nr:MotA/TolQ/ExbB proton channel family protein [Campylobacterota bacterium]
MKKLFLTITTLLMIVSTGHASELDRAYKKEYAFLKAQKAELQTRLASDTLRHDEDLLKAKEKVVNLQQILLDINKKVDLDKEKLSKLASKLSDTEDNGNILGNVINQARLTLEEYGVKISENNSTSDADKLKKAFMDAGKLYVTLSSLQNTKGAFYLPDGKRVEGDIVKVGNIAAYGISADATGALAPAGNGAYKLWNAVGSSDDAKAFFAKEMRESMDLFTYENLDKEVDYVKEKTISDTVEGGGVIGYIILVLGAFGLLLLVFRVFNLIKAGSNVTKISDIVVKKVESGKGSEALNAIKDFEGSTARVIKSALRNINKDREHVEDIIMENILNESSQIDRFGSFVLVIAAVAPLMGLLGTVTGMIETFDVITEFGTGDPKLLSGGISAALVTTMLGLIVAIPLLLLGNLLSGWAQSIKDSMEQSALHIVNLYEKHRV